MAKVVKKHYRHKHTREVKRTIIIACEGKRNKTEKAYFIELERKLNNCHFVFAEGKTDPLGIVKNAIQKASEIEMFENDKVYAVFDIDNDISKKSKIINAYEYIKKTGANVQIVTSNPSFEVWYLLHFTYTTKTFKDSKEVEKSLKKYIPNYSKNRCEIDILYPKTSIAIRNVQKLNKYHSSITNKKNDDYWNPNTSIFNILREIVS